MHYGVAFLIGSHAVIRGRDVASLMGSHAGTTQTRSDSLSPLALCTVAQRLRTCVSMPARDRARRTLARDASAADEGALLIRVRGAEALAGAKRCRVRERRPAGDLALPPAATARRAGTAHALVALGAMHRA